MEIVFTSHRAIKKAKGFYIDFRNAFQRQSYNIAAFHLHQATEHAYYATLLVFTGYKLMLHNLEKLANN
ncbi:MAG: HEPN domain-containing protein [bacterium]